ncbi:hypothetical protein MK079_03135 [Candidatus Gracilibacteria bacterium]|nr:hypothetical protein [Candidatus Gracilibacteria bacterium]
MILNHTIHLELQGRGVISLSPNDHIATGGEGSVYKVGKSNIIVKLYSDARKMARDGMNDKLKLLSKIQHPSIVAPEGLVLYNSKPIGYYMPFVEGEHLSRIFTNSWQNRNNFTFQDILSLVDHMRLTVQAAHDANAIMVDANEINWIVQQDRQKNYLPKVIDVDSWSVGRWPATVVMPSIRDYHSQYMDEMTDWFSWGIVSFQVFAGIHPYKGTLEGYKPKDMELRMKANASVFSENIRLNNAVRDFHTIPAPLLEWYMASFHDGERSIPPSPYDTGVLNRKMTRIKRVVQSKGISLIYDKLFEGSEKILRVFPCGILLDASGKLIHLGTQKIISHTKIYDCELIEVQDGWLKAEKIDSQIIWIYIQKSDFKEVVLENSISGNQVICYQNRMFVCNEQGFTEVQLQKFIKPVLTIKNTWGVIQNSTKWYHGVGIQSTLGAKYVMTPFGDQFFAQVRVKEIDDLKIVNAHSGPRYVVLVGVNKKGEYKKIELLFDRNYKNYQYIESDSESAELNMVVLPKGVSASIVEDNELRIFVPTTQTLKKIDDKDVSTDMQLYHWNDIVLYVQGKSVWKIKMKGFCFEKPLERVVFLYNYCDKAPFICIEGDEIVSGIPLPERLSLYSFWRVSDPLPLVFSVSAGPCFALASLNGFAKP